MERLQQSLAAQALDVATQLLKDAAKHTQVYLLDITIMCQRVGCCCLYHCKEYSRVDGALGLIVSCADFSVADAVVKALRFGRICAVCTQSA